MAAFEYVALDGRGKKKKGILEADSARQIRQQLRDKGWFVQEVQQA
ncbi:type II secretion system protein GspF, partial [Reinekea forsetii]|nr:type II secretion system protein GspF [Reinekea forsetii]